MAEVKTAPQVAGASVSTDFTSNWVVLESSASNIKESFTVEQFKAAGFRLKIRVALNTNGNPYLFAIDTENNLGSAIYLSTPLRAKLMGISVEDLKALKAKAEKAKKVVDYSKLNEMVLPTDQISLIVVVDEDGAEGLMVASAGGTGNGDWA